MKISIVTPTLRPNSLEMNHKCLERQTFKSYEWLVVSPYEYKHAIWIPEPEKKEGNYYNLNAAWNAAFKVAKGDLIISIVDLLYFLPDTLERLWGHYQANKKSCISLTGNQYDRIENGKPEGLVWTDPRVKDNQTFYEIPPYDLELCIASLPKKGIFDVGGMDEEYDKSPAWSEKELACRMAAIGYKCYIDTTIEYRALHHERLNSKWDKLYPISTARFVKDYKDIQEGKRTKIDYLTI